jgi:hypothetical protein
MKIWFAFLKSAAHSDVLSLSYEGLPSFFQSNELFTGQTGNLINSKIYFKYIFKSTAQKIIFQIL